MFLPNLKCIILFYFAFIWCKCEFKCIQCDLVFNESTTPYNLCATHFNQITRAAFVVPESAERFARIAFDIENKVCSGLK